MHTNLVLSVFIYLALLGLSAIDPVGIAVMPLLLIQDRPFKRSFVFVSGSFMSLMTMGIVFAFGFGKTVLNFEQSNSWFVPSIELVGGVVLLGIATALLWRLKLGKSSVDPPQAMVKRLELGNWQLFGVGATLVGIQSILDVVFVIAMVRVGQLHMSGISVILAVATYSLAALVLQLLVVLIYKLTPSANKDKALSKIHILLAKYANQALIVVSFLLGCALLALAYLK